MGLLRDMVQSDNEGARPERKATGGDLQELFLRTSGWLERNTPELIEPKDPVIDHVGGVPVVASAPRHEFTIPEDIVREFATGAAATLKVGSGITLVHFKEHFLPKLPDHASTDLDYRPERCEFINEQPSVDVEAEHLSIDLTGKYDEDGSYKSDRMIYRQPGTSPIIGHVVDMETASDSSEGVQQVMTFKEFKAFDEILDSLDLMKEAIDARTPSGTKPELPS